jgi:hypothetical protein
MSYIIRNVGEDGENGTDYESLEDAKKFAKIHVENYKHGFEIIDTENNSIVYTDKREEVSRTDLIDWD